MHHLFEDLDQLRQCIYQLIRDKDESLRILSNGTIQIGHMHPMSKSYKYIDIPTEKQEFNMMEKLMREMNVLKKNMYEIQQVLRAEAKNQINCLRKEFLDVGQA